MNNQMPYNFMPQCNMNLNNDIRMLYERIEYLEKRVGKLERKINIQDNKPTPTPYNNQEYPTNYMI